jgi:hypothetical protein
MKPYNTIIYILFFTITTNGLAREIPKSEIDKTIKYLYKTLQSTQCKQDIEAKPFVTGEDKGLYRSYIHLNIMDDYNSIFSKPLREYVSVPDMNMFVTNFVVYSLLEAYNYDGLEDVDMESLNMALTQLLNFQDKNNKDIPLYTFWKQVNINGIWSQHPDNICNAVAFMDYFTNDNVINFLDKWGMGSIANILRFAKELERSFKNAYRIPSDIDDTSLNLGLTGMLYKMRPKFGNSTDFWIDANQNIKGLFEFIKSKAYIPFKQGMESANDITDSRTYYFLRDFLKENYSKGNFDIRLPPTWALDYNLQKVFAPLVSMPFSTNNVDFNVAANFLFGVTSIVLNHPDQKYIQEAFDDDMKLIYRSTIDLIVWTMEGDRLGKRSELALLYYPSIFDFYWLVSRTYSMLNNFNFEVNKIADSEFFKEARGRLGSILKTKGTEQIMSKINKSSEGSYFMEFLGNYNGVNRGEDSTFATGLALNSLINIWTSDEMSNQFKVKRTVYTKDNPNFQKCEIDKTIDDVVRFVVNKFNYFLGPEVQGAFFSGSVKNLGTIELFYPSNFNKFYNGTDIPDPSNPKYIKPNEMVSAVKGFISEMEYGELLGKTWYGFKVPMEEHVLNNSAFPFWSSPSITYSINLLGLSKYNKIVG